MAHQKVAFFLPGWEGYWVLIIVKQPFKIPCFEVKGVIKMVYYIFFLLAIQREGVSDGTIYRISLLKIPVMV
jgi:hypothetical protein